MDDIVEEKQRREEGAVLETAALVLNEEGLRGAAKARGVCGTDLEAVEAAVVEAAEAEKVVGAFSKREGREG